MRRPRNISLPTQIHELVVSTYFQNFINKETLVVLLYQAMVTLLTHLWICWLSPETSCTDTAILHQRQDSARVRNISGQEALKPRPQNNQSARTPFVITFNPALPNASAAVRKNLNILHSSASCKQTFWPPPVVAYKMTLILRDLLVRTQLCDNTNPQRKPPPGIYKCNHPRCLTCPFLQEGQTKILSLQLKKNDL